MSDQNVLTELLVKVLSAFDEASSKQALAAVDKQQDQITGKEKKGQADRTKNLAASLATGLKHVEGYTKGTLGFAEKITLGFASVVTAIEGGAVAGTFALAKLSKGLSDAYYSGQKVGAAVKDMEAFRFASEQMGSSAEKAQAGINELGHLRNTNPAAYVGLLQRLGVAATDAAGKLRSPAQAAMDLAPALAKLPRQMQLLYGNQLGFDDDQTLSMVRPEFLAKLKQFKQMQAQMGFDPDKAAADGAKFQQVWGRASAALDIITKKIDAAFLGRVGGSLDKVTTWVVKNADRITNAVVRVGDFVVHLATSFVDLVTSFDRLSPSAQRFLEVLGGLVALSLTLRSGPIAAIMALAAAVAFLWDDYEKYKEGLPSIVDWASWEPKIKAAIDGLTSLWTKFDELSTKLTGQGGLQIAMEAFAVYMAGAWVARILGAFGAVGSGWLGLLARLAMNPAVAVPGLMLGAGAAAGGMNVGHTDEYGRDAGTWGGDAPAKDGDPQPKGRPTVTFGTMWDWLKGKMGFGDDPRVKDAILATADATQKLVEKADRAGADGGGGGGGGGAMFGKAAGYIGRVFNRFGGSSFHGLGNFGEEGWWTPERQSHAIDVLMKEAGLTEAGAKALVSRWKFVESPGGPNAVNPRSGAEGIAQWLGGRKGDGSKGTFDEQLKKAARELNGSEGRAKTLLNTPGKEATGASAFERAEGYNARTGEDNFTARTAEGMKHIVHGAAPAPAATPAAPAPAVTRKVADLEVFGILAQGPGATPSQLALIEAWKTQNPGRDPSSIRKEDVLKATPSEPVQGPSSYPTLWRNPKTGRMDTSGAPEIDHSKPTSASPPAKHRRDRDGVRTVDIPETSPSGQPVKVEVTDGSAAKIGGHVGKQFPSWMTRGRDGQAYQTTDMRDPKHAPFHPDDDRAARARRSDHWWGSTALHFAHGSGDNPLTDLYRSGWAKHTAVPGGLMVSPASLYRAYDKAPGSGAGPVVNQHIAINGIHNPKDIEHHLKVHAKRGVQDTLRHMQGPSQ